MVLETERYIKQLRLKTARDYLRTQNLNYSVNAISDADLLNIYSLLVLKEKIKNGKNAWQIKNYIL